MQADPKKKMPPAGNKLKDKEIADLRYWIQAMSAFWPEEITKPNPAADVRAGRRFPRRQLARRLHEAGGPAARFSALRRALGAALAGCRPLRRRLRCAGSPPRVPRLRDGSRRLRQHVALSRLGDPGLQ